MKEKPLVVCRVNPAVGNFLVLFTLLMAFVSYREWSTFPVSLKIVLPSFTAMLWAGRLFGVPSITVVEAGIELRYAFSRKLYPWNYFKGYYTGTQTEYGLNVDKGLPALSKREKEIHLVDTNEKTMKYSDYAYKNLPELVAVVGKYLPKIDAPAGLEKKNFKKDE